MTQELNKAPWTDEQVKSLNKYQQCSWVHPFTCGGKNCRRVLVATPNGWICPKCDYKQDWAHEFMLKFNEHPMENPEETLKKLQKESNIDNED